MDFIESGNLFDSSPRDRTFTPAAAFRGNREIGTSFPLYALHARLSVYSDAKRR